MLNIHGFNHGDPNYDNFIIDKDDNVHIIDFGLAYTTKERGPRLFGHMIDEDDDDVEYISPIHDYEYKTFPLTASFDIAIENLVDIAETADENWKKIHLI